MVDVEVEDERKLEKIVDRINQIGGVIDVGLFKREEISEILIGHLTGRVEVVRGGKG